MSAGPVGTGNDSGSVVAGGRVVSVTPAASPQAAAISNRLAVSRARLMGLRRYSPPPGFPAWGVALPTAHRRSAGFGRESVLQPARMLPATCAAL